MVARLTVVGGGHADSEVEGLIFMVGTDSHREAGERLTRRLLAGLAVL